MKPAFSCNNRALRNFQDVHSRSSSASFPLPVLLLLLLLTQGPLSKSGPPLSCCGAGGAPCLSHGRRLRRPLDSCDDDTAPRLACTACNTKIRLILDKKTPHNPPREACPAFIPHNDVITCEEESRGGLKSCPTALS